MLVYLDSSAIVKRYVEERGSGSIDVLYETLEKVENVRAAFSVWNVGEVIGAIDSRHQRGDIDGTSTAEAIKLLVGETRKFAAMRKLMVLPISNRMLEESRDLVVKHHIYQADALQLAAARQCDSALFVTADKRLLECGKLEKLQTANPEMDNQEIANVVMGSTVGSTGRR